MGKRGSCIVFGGDIHTMDAMAPRAEAVAIRDGRIVHVGDLAGARSAAPSAEAIDLRGRVAFPAFVESHSHPLHYGRALEQVDCRPLREVEAIVGALRARAQETPPGEWVLGGAYDDTLLREMRHPDRRDLDRASRDHPIQITHISGHNVAVNSRALERAGITAETPDPSGGSVDRDAGGQPTGILWEWAQDLLDPHLPAVSVDDRRRHLRAAAEAYLRAGVASVVDAGVGIGGSMEDVEAFAKVAATGEVPVRLGAAILYPVWRRLHAGEGPGLTWNEDTASVRPVAVKLFQDGSIQLRTAALRQPYWQSGEPTQRHLIWPREELDAMVADAHRAGWQVWIHGNGDLAIETILDAYEKAVAADPRADHRHRIEHCQTVGEDQLDRMARLGVLASFFPAHVWYWGDRHQEIFLGPARARRISPLASALRRGIVFGMHNDSPVTPVSPLLLIGTAVTRLTSGGQVLGTEQGIAVGQAVRAMTLDSAYLAHEEAEKGSLEVGKLGDLVVLEADPDLVSPVEIKDIPVAMTVVGGEVAYAS